MIQRCWIMEEYLTVNIWERHEQDKKKKNLCPQKLRVV